MAWKEVVCTDGATVSHSGSGADMRCEPHVLSGGGVVTVGLADWEVKANQGRSYAEVAVEAVVTVTSTSGYVHEWLVYVFRQDAAGSRLGCRIQSQRLGGQHYSSGLYAWKDSRKMDRTDLYEVREWVGPVRRVLEDFANDVAEMGYRQSQVARDRKPIYTLKEDPWAGYTGEDL